MSADVNIGVELLIAEAWSTEGGMRKHGGMARGWLRHTASLDDAVTAPCIDQQSNAWYGIIRIIGTSLMTMLPVSILLPW